MTEVGSARFSRGEEGANATIHGLGAVLGAVGLVFLIAEALGGGREGSLAAVIVYGSSLVALYLFSTLHHALRHGRIKRLFLTLDHAGIYLLIAGTYTPFCLLLDGDTRWTLMAVVWGLAGIGIAGQFVAFALGRGRAYEKVGFVLYLAMGWLPSLATSGGIFESLAVPGFVLLVAGGVVYSLGVPFYLWRNLRFGHAVWHLFVVGGSALHFASILLYVVPEPV